MEEDIFDDDYCENPMYDYCPKCHRHYDCIDFDYQSCSKCGWDAEAERFDSKIRLEPSDEDYLNGDADILTGEYY